MTRNKRIAWSLASSEETMERLIAYAAAVSIIKSYHASSASWLVDFEALVEKISYTEPLDEALNSTLKPRERALFEDVFKRLKRLDGEILVPQMGAFDMTRVGFSSRVNQAITPFAIEGTGLIRLPASLRPMFLRKVDLEDTDTEEVIETLICFCRDGMPLGQALAAARALKG